MLSVRGPELKELRKEARKPWNKIEDRRDCRRDQTITSPRIISNDIPN